MKAILLFYIGFLVLFTFLCETRTQDVRNKSKKGENTGKIDRKQRKASKFRRIVLRLDVLEVNQNAEIQYRKEDTELIFEKISGIEQILNTSLITSEQCENKIPDHSNNDLIENVSIDRNDEYSRLMTAFEDEKRVNAKIRGKVRKMENNIEKCFIDKMEIKDYFTNISRENSIINEELEVLPTIVSENITHLTNELQQMKDLMAKQQMKDIITQEQKIKDLVTQQQIKDLVTQQQIKDLMAKQQMKDLVTQEQIKDLVTQQQMKALVTQEQMKDLVTQEQMKDLVTQQQIKALVTQEQMKDLMTKQQEVLSTVLLKFNLVSKELNESKIIQEENAELYSLNLAVSCKDLYQKGYLRSGIHKIKPSMSEKPFQVYCDQTNDGGGWTVFQRRLDDSVDFNKTWEEYENGFGDMSGDFWLGNKYLNLLTGSGTHELLIVLEDWKNKRTYASYSEFNVLSEKEQYKLIVKGYSGDARDSMRYSHGQMFSTHDRDNDRHPTHHCTRMYSGGWWYNQCTHSHLNHIYNKGDCCPYPTRGLHWYRKTGGNFYLKFIEMKFR